MNGDNIFSQNISLRKYKIIFATLSFHLPQKLYYYADDTMHMMTLCDLESTLVDDTLQIFLSAGLHSIANVEGANTRMCTRVELFIKHLHIFHRFKTRVRVDYVKEGDYC